jgi:hypothetical protein
MEEDVKGREYLYPLARTPAKGKEHPPRILDGRVDSLGLITSFRGFGKGEREGVPVLGWKGVARGRS